MSDDHDGKPFNPKWNAAFLICRQCRKRKNGPHMKAKVLVTTVRGITRDVEPRPRIVLTSCLGLCPKGATALAYVGGAVDPRVVAIKSCAKLEAVMPLLVADST